MTGWIDGSWRQLKDWASRQAVALRDEARLITARAECLRVAIERSEGIAAAQILHDFQELELAEVIDDILAVLRQCLVVMITSTGGGALIGGIAGGIGGAGVGAIPGAAVGAAAGAQVGEWILLAMGLKMLAEYIVQDMPKVARSYRDGLRQAWLAAAPSPLPQHAVQVNAFALQDASATLARGHVAMFVLLLMGIVAWLAKGRGSAAELAGNSRLGSRFSRWLVRNEGKLKAEPRLRRLESVPAARRTEVAERARRPSPAPRAGTSQPRSAPSKAQPLPDAATKTTSFGKVPKEITTSSGIVVKPTDGKTTTVLGSFSSDMDNIINGQLAYPKTTNFGAKPGGYNVLNVPDTMFQSRTPDQFWREVNAPFLDSAMRRGDPVYIATRPSAATLLKKDGSLTGFGREMKYLKSNGYIYDPSTGMMTKP